VVKYVLYWTPFAAAAIYAFYKFGSGSQATGSLMLLLGTLMFGAIRTVQHRIHNR